VYGSAETHFSVTKAAAAIGVSARPVPTDDAFRIDVSALEAAIERDRADGLTPFCVVGNAGTTATGAVDDLGRIADVADRERLWFHVDGAYGAPAAASDVAAAEFAGLDRADSLSVDAHKWLYVPVDCSVLLLRDAADSYGAFGPASDYVRVLADADDEAFAFWDHGLELSRRSRALKLWLTFRYYGADRLAQAIGEDIRLAQLMGDIVRTTEDLELLCEPSLSVCCFRQRPRDMSDDALDGHNEALLARLQRDGRAYFSNVSVAGRFGLRACITNFRTTEEDVRQSLAIVQELGS
jgi:glutamate/tyrosine decarboxylase-like PLP-dependent enzyme